MREKFRRLWQDLIAGRTPVFGIWLIVMFGLISIVAIPLLLTSSKISFVDFRNTGPIGDTINGIAGPFIAVLAAFLTFIAFYIQYQANLAQTKQFNIQDTNTRIERFENKFYELLRLHKENLHEIKIIRNDTYLIEERKAFVSMFYEFKYTFFCAREIYKIMEQRKEVSQIYTDEQLIRLAYIFFYCGVGDNSDLMSKAMNVSVSHKFDDALFDRVRDKLKDLKQLQSQNRPTYKDSVTNVVKIDLHYTPWGGHQSRLGHYYRHLFQTVKYVANQEDSFLNKVQKSEYLRTLRAQLSDHEQLMLYYNALAGFGEAWIDDKKNGNINYFTEYHIIHNIPIPLANFGISPEIKFKDELAKDPSLFEWLE